MRGRALAVSLLEEKQLMKTGASFMHVRAGAAAEDVGMFACFGLRGVLGL